MRAGLFGLRPRREGNLNIRIVDQTLVLGRWYAAEPSATTAARFHIDTRSLLFERLRPFVFSAFCVKQLHGDEQNDDGDDDNDDIGC